MSSVNLFVDFDSLPDEILATFSSFYTNVIRNLPSNYKLNSYVFTSSVVGSVNTKSFIKHRIVPIKVSKKPRDYTFRSMRKGFGNDGDINILVSFNNYYIWQFIEESLECRSQMYTLIGEEKMEEMRFVNYKHYIHTLPPSYEDSFYFRAHGN